MASTSEVKNDPTDTPIESQSSVDTNKAQVVETDADIPVEINYFSCLNCPLRERFEYFGMAPPFAKKIKLLEECYIIEDPFLPPKRGEILILGAHCIKCNKSVCKNTNCSIYFGGTYCIQCAKYGHYDFPNAVKDKLGKIVVEK